MAEGISVDDGPADVNNYRSFVQTITQLLSDGWYCCTDFKARNVVWRQGRYQLIDLDGVGIVMDSHRQTVVNDVTMATRVATYPIVVNVQEWYGYGAMDLVQTWYGGLVSVVGYQENKYKIRGLHYTATTPPPFRDLERSVPPLLSVLFGEITALCPDINREEREEYDRVKKAINRMGPVRCNTESVAVMQELRRLLFVN
jgi:hypothetical protein